MSFSSNIKHMLADPATGELSSRRVVGVLGFLFLAITLLINSFHDETIKPASELVDAVSFIVISALFSSSIDKFASMKGK